MPISNRVDKSLFALPEPRRFRDKTHRIRVKQPRLLCRRQLADAHHLADRAASCAWGQGEQRIHLHRPVVMSPHCEVHRCGMNPDGGREPASLRPFSPCGVAGDGSTANIFGRTSLEGAAPVSAKTSGVAFAPSPTKHAQRQKAGAEERQGGRRWRGRKFGRRRIRTVCPGHLDV